MHSYQSAIMTKYDFRVLRLDELDAAYAILEEVTQWLLDQGVRQWLQPLPYEVYRQRQQHGDNFGLFADGDLAAVVSLLDDRPGYWEAHLPKTRFKWLATLASARRYKGQDLGQLVIERSEEYLTNAGFKQVYLDCIYGSGMLPKYYVLLGFEQVAREKITFPHGTSTACSCANISTRGCEASCTLTITIDDLIQVGV